ncbi:S24 family peptidase [Tateyamaria sp.]|uniref:S24 family peptidase n=1 Tax=Tateyamaria sp. TaxID=1929288 RepID=UPI003B216E94
MRGAIAMRNLTHDTLETLCRALDLEFYIGPPRGTLSAESSALPPPAWDIFTEATLPHRGLAKCAVQGWAKAQPELAGLPKPENVMDETAFWVSATGQSMIPEGIDGGCICLVSPGAEAREGDRIWILDHQGQAAIKRLVGKSDNGTLTLRGWMPKRDGQQKIFDEERMAAGIREFWPIVAVFRGKPGSERCEYIPDPKPPEHVLISEAPNIAPLAAIPSEITDMLGLPAGSDADAVVRAMEAKIVGRGTAHATSAAVLDRRTLERTLDSKLRAESRSLEERMAAMLDARLPPQDEDGQSMTIRHLALRQAHDVRAAGGVGEEIFEEAETGTLYIAADDLPPNLDPDRLVGIRAAGRSMEPTIHDEDVLVLNPDATDPREGAVFVIRTDSGLVVKRLRREGDTWTMTSDAPGWEPRPVTGQDRIIGHVVWFGPEGVIVQE